MNLLDFPEEILQQIFALLIKPIESERKGARFLIADSLPPNPFYESIKSIIPIFLQCRLVSKEFQRQADQANPNRFVSLLPSLRKMLLNFTNVEAIREPKTSSIFGTLLRWVNVQELRDVVPLMINKLFKTDADKSIAKNIFNSAVYLQLGPANQTIGIPIPNDNNSYVAIQLFFAHSSDTNISSAITAGICEFEQKKAPGEIRTKKEIFDNYSKNIDKYVKKHEVLAINNGRIVNGVFQVTKKVVNALVTALGAPQWSVQHEYGDKREPGEYEYCFIRLILSMLNYHQLAIEYSNDEIEISLSGGPLFGIYSDNVFSIVDDRIAEILPPGKNPSLAQLAHDIKALIAAHKVTFDSLERATLYHQQLRNALSAYWLMHILRIKNKKRYRDICTTLQGIVPQLTMEKYSDLFEKKIEWFKFDRTFAEFHTINSSIYGRWLSFGYSITFNPSQMVVFKIDCFQGAYSINSVIIRGVGIKSLQNKKNETILLMTDVYRQGENMETSIPHPDVVQELKSLMEFPENLSDVATMNFFLSLATLYATTDVNWFDFVSPRSTETYFLSHIGLDDSDSEFSESEFMDTDED